MRAFLVTSDVVFSVLILSLAILITVHVASTTTKTLADIITVESIKKQADHAVDVLLFAQNEEFRCRFGSNDIPVPLCVWNNGADRNDFWVGTEVNCSVVSSDVAVGANLATMLGCYNTYPSSFRSLYIRAFKLCWSDATDDNAVLNCRMVEANLIVWK